MDKEINAIQSGCIFCVNIILCGDVYDPFWDWIPTAWAHQQYCEAEAGLTIYKTPEQWDKENPGVLDNLSPYEKSKYVQTSFGKTEQLNDRFGKVFKIDRISKYAVKKESLIYLDIDSDEAIIKYTDFSRGYGPFMAGRDGYWKFWLEKDSCFSNEERIKKLTTLKVHLTNLSQKGNDYVYTKC